MLPNSHTYISLIPSLTYAPRWQFQTFFSLLKPLTFPFHAHSQLLIGFLFFFYCQDCSNQKRTVWIPTVTFTSCPAIASSCCAFPPIIRDDPSIKSKSLRLYTQSNPCHLLKDLTSAVLSYTKLSLSSGAFLSAHKYTITSLILKKQQSLLMTALPLAASGPFVCSSLEQTSQKTHLYLLRLVPLQFSLKPAPDQAYIPITPQKLFLSKLPWLTCC